MSLKNKNCVSILLYMTKQSKYLIKKCENVLKVK